MLPMLVTQRAVSMVVLTVLGKESLMQIKLLSLFFFSLNKLQLSKPCLTAACFLHRKSVTVHGIKNIAKHLKEIPYGSLSEVKP